MQPAPQHMMEYAPPPNMRSPSPTSSVGSRHPDDQTSLSDLELDQLDFEKKWEEIIGLGAEPQPESDANSDPLIQRPWSGSEEETSLFESILQNLRRQVDLLHENELFEQTLLQGSKAALETPVYDRDIDAIMRSMMGSSSSSSTAFPSATSTPFVGRSFRTRPSAFHSSAFDADMGDGPWNDPDLTRGEFGAGMDSFIGVAPPGANLPMNAADLMRFMPQHPPEFSAAIPYQPGRRSRPRTLGTGRR